MGFAAGHCPGRPASHTPHPLGPGPQLLRVLLRDSQLPRARLSPCQAGKPHIALLHAARSSLVDGPQLSRMVAAVTAPEKVQAGSAATWMAAAAVAVLDTLGGWRGLLQYNSDSGSSQQLRSSHKRRADTMAAMHAAAWSRGCSQCTGQQLHRWQQPSSQQQCKWPPDCCVA